MALPAWPPRCSRLFSASREFASATYEQEKKEIAMWRLKGSLKIQKSNLDLSLIYQQN